MGMIESSKHLLNDFFENQLKTGDQAFFFKECNPAKLSCWQVLESQSSVYELTEVTSFNPAISALGEFSIKQWCFTMKQPGKVKISFILRSPDNALIQKQIDIRLCVK